MKGVILAGGLGKAFRPLSHTGPKQLVPIANKPVIHYVIEDLVAGKDVKLKATAYGTDCYPRKKLETLLNIKDLNEAVLFNPRNVYQNYNVAVNLSDKVIYTYMGVLKPQLGNANYCSASAYLPKSLPISKRCPFKDTF